MAKNETSAQAEPEGLPTTYAEIMGEIDGRDRIVIEDGDGNEYTLRYTRRIVKDMERSGITAEKAADALKDATLTAVEGFITDFVAPAFRTDQPKMSKDEVIALWQEMPDKDVLIAYLIALFNQPMTALVKNPTETRAKFRLV